jgi:hypothetical protein
VRSPIELSTGSSVSNNPKHWKPFGCPTYVLDNELQGSKPFHKWQRQSKPGIYLGTSPLHGRNVALVLSRETGLVSPQFHVAFDPSFDTVRTMTTGSSWQIEAGFVIQKGLQKKKKGDKTTGSPPNKEVPTKKRRRVEASKEQGNNKDQNEQTIPQAAADVGDGGQPTPPPESETQREAQPERPEQVTRSGRKAKPAPRLVEAMATEIAHATRKDVKGEIFCYATVFADDDKYDHEGPLLIYIAVSDPNTMFFTRQ